MIMTTSTLNFLMIFMTCLGSPISFFMLSIALIGLLLLHGKRRDAMDFFSVMSLSAVLVIAIKQIVARPRPPTMNTIASGASIQEIGYSFPSAHALIAIVFFLCIAHFYESHIKSKIAKYFFISINVLMIILIGYSRIYLGVHYVSDVIGGYLIGGLIFIIFFKLRKRRAGTGKRFI